MEFASIYHRTSDNWCYPLDSDTLEIKIRTGYDVTAINIFYGDPYEGGIMGGDWTWNGQKQEISEVCNLQYHKIWTVQISPKFKRLKYHFEIFADQEVTLFYENGFMTHEESQIPGKKIQSFMMPWLNEIDVKTTPKWAASTIWYQIFPDRFARGNFDINNDIALPWASRKPSNEDVYGGDLQGIINRLDYLKDLGITGIYLNPIFTATSTHKYDTVDYFDIDPGFGDKQTFKKLVVECHKRDIRVMLDGVFNHSGNEFPLWKEVLEKGEDSNFYDWFMVNEWPIDPYKGHTRDKEFYSFAFAANMPKLNTNNPEVIEYIATICEYWIKEYDIDGWRLDVANEISHELCKVIQKRCRALKPDIYILGEIWHDSINWLQGDEFDAVMNYPLTNAIDDFWRSKDATNKQLEYAINTCYQRYMRQTNEVLFNMLDSHDTERMYYRVNHDKDVFYQQFIMLFTMTGSMSLYYGTEIIMDGAHDPLCRACMPWDKIDAGKYDEDINNFKCLISLRKNNDALVSQNIKFEYNHDDNRVIEYLKDNRVRVVINSSDKEITLSHESCLFSRKMKDNKLLPGGVAITAV